MPRYFIELAYRGTRYSGFQVQENAPTVQMEVEKAFSVLHRRPVELTGSSRTDAGVHARQNFFHFDSEEMVHEQFVYKMNAILPDDIAVRGLYQVGDAQHCRFDAVARRYRYYVHRRKDPFLRDRSLYFPYRVNREEMERAAELVKGHHNFLAFSKTNTQVKQFECTVVKSGWEETEWGWVYEVEANRFLRGMVRLLVGSMLKVGRGKMGLEAFGELVEGRGKAGYSVAGHGLFLEAVVFPEKYFPAPVLGLAGK